MKKQKIKIILDQIAEKNNAKIWLNESKSSEIADKLTILEDADLKSIQKIIESGGYMIKESIDFSNTSYLLSQLIDVINSEDDD